MFGKTASLVRLMCKPLMASGPASHVKPVPKQTFGRASPEAAREAARKALPNGPKSISEFESESEAFVLLSYPRISKFVFVFDSKYSKKCYPNLIPCESDLFPSLPVVESTQKNRD